MWSFLRFHLIWAAKKRILVKMNNNDNNNIGWVLRLITDDIALANENTALVFDSCSIFLGSGDIVCYQPQTIQYYIIIMLILSHIELGKWLTILWSVTSKCDR